MPTEENDAPFAKSGISKELLKEIDAQHATILYAIKLINQQVQATQQDAKNVPKEPGWVYNMKDLENWIKHYPFSMSILATAKQTCARDGCNHPKSIHNEITLVCHAVILSNPWEDARQNTNWIKTDCACNGFIEPTEETTT